MNAMEIMKSDSFLSASYEIIHKILEMPALLCSEARIFEALIKWARTSWQNQNISDDADNSRRQL